jgi:hypothetical protein
VCGDYEPIRPVAADRSPWNSVLRLVMVVVVEAVEPEAAFVATLEAVKRSGCTRRTRGKVLT